ncbi:beta-N-acetylhexosaminidase [Bifidobacterium callitrichidarum]|uniref:beta-N-acetylhexosaminidase n=1 Tax=Bifidobacterium callitrichidarum TaxID=2052941 RepID=UPI001F4E925A|nr:family 20 glycosylhydrolase [Bifidobacterium callitrichidarum]
MNATKRLDFIPYPSSVRYLDGEVRLGPQTGIANQFPTDWALDVPIRQLADELRCDCGSSSAQSSDVVVLTADRRLADDEYTIDIHHIDGMDGDGEPEARDNGVGSGPAAPVSASIAIAAGGEAGLRYGIQTFRQIIRQSPHTLPCLHVQDKPTFATRAYSLDVTRGRVPTLRFLQWFADQLAFYKYNQFQLYVEHAFAFKGLSESWRGTDPLTAEDITQLDRYCAARGIELVPSLATFGHMYMNLRTRSYRALGEFPEEADRPFSFVERQEHHTLNAADPRALRFAQGLIDQYIPLFRSRCFNIGGDETFDLGRGQSAKDAPGMSRSELYAGFVTGLCRTLSEHGRMPMLWADIALESPETMALLPRDIIMLNWMYEPDIDESKVRALAEQGRRQFVCPAVRTWNRLFPDFAGAWANITHMAEAGRKYGAEGMLVTDWGDYGNVNDPRLSLPGLCYGAQQSWNPGELGTGENRGGDTDGTMEAVGASGFEAMNARISRLVYDDPSGRVMGELALLAGSTTSFTWDLAVQVLELDAGDGSLNTQVAARVERMYDRGVLAFDRVQGCADARRRLLIANRDMILKRDACNRRLDEGERAIRAALNGDRTSVLIQVMVEGQRLLNDLGVELLTMAERSADTASWTERRYQLAAQLELWFERYRRSWLEIGRPAELDRIAHVIWSHADILRAGEL